MEILKWSYENFILRILLCSHLYEAPYFFYIYLNLYFHFFALVSRLSAVLSSATQHSMPPEFGRKWGTACLTTRFPLLIRLCAGYSVKLVIFKYFIFFIAIEPTTCCVYSQLCAIAPRLPSICTLQFLRYKLEMKSIRLYLRSAAVVDISNLLEQ